MLDGRTLEQMTPGWSETREQKLARRLAQGRRDALEQIVRTYTPYVSSVAWRTAQGQVSREDMEEIAADVFLALWNSRDRLKTEKGLRPWLAASARNRTIDRLRRAKAPPSAPLEEVSAQADSTQGPESQAEQREQSRRLWQAVESLGEPDTSLIVRYYVQQEKLKDVAAELGLNLSTAKSRLRRGRQRLKEILTQGGDWE